MDDTDKRFGEGLTQAGKLIFALIGHVTDPETGERIIDDPAFKAAAGIRDEQKKQSA